MRKHLEKYLGYSISISSFTQLCLTLRPHGLQYSRLPCPSPPPGACSNSCPASWWYHPTISSSVVPVFCLQSFPASGSFPVSRLYTSGDQSIGDSASNEASVLPMNIQGWFPLGLTGLIYLLSKSESCSVMSDSLRPHGLYSPWNSPGQNTGNG